MSLHQHLSLHPLQYHLPLGPLHPHLSLPPLCQHICCVPPLHCQLVLCLLLMVMSQMRDQTPIKQKVSKVVSEHDGALTSNSNQCQYITKLHLTILIGTVTTIIGQQCRHLSQHRRAMFDTYAVKTTAKQSMSKHQYDPYNQINS